jgi:hypothetical protein
MYEYLADNGMSRDEYHFFLGNRVKQHCVMGNDYYVTNEHRVFADGSTQASAEVFGYDGITWQYYDRYRLPVMRAALRRRERGRRRPRRRRRPRAPRPARRRRQQRGKDDLQADRGAQRGRPARRDPGRPVRRFWFVKQAFLRCRPGAAIVNVASVHAVETTPLVSAYAAAKAALVSLTRSAAIEGRPKGIRVNAVLPGAIETPMLRENPR